MSVRKDLGMVTAYAYAVSKGYAGTEEQFAALMADYAAVGERAEAAATAAAASATAASGSASDSAASATAAAGSSTAASTAAGNASQAATTATTKASEAAQSATAAAGSATTASTKAGEAAQSATQAAGNATAAESAKTAAQTAQTAAQTAQTAAETAQTAAETAQTAAEDAAESVSASAAQIAQNTADISSVKNALGATLIIDTASGAIATFTDGSDGVPMESVTVAMEPIQDLHGQDAPYPGGGGANIAEMRKTNSTSSGVTLTANSDGTVSVTGTASASALFTLLNNLDDVKAQFAEGGTFALSENKTSGLNISVSYRETADAAVSYLSMNGTKTVPQGSIFNNIYMNISSGTVVNLTNYAVIIAKSATVLPFAPYSNICPISGRSEVGVWRSGVNVWDEEWEVGEINSATGENVSATKRIRTKGYIRVLPSASYYITTANIQWVCLYDRFQNYIGTATTTPSGTGGIIQTTADTAYMRVSFNNAYGNTYNNDISINYPSTDHDYHASDIASITVQLGQTVYGGTVDVVSGVMTVDRAMVDLGTGNWEARSDAVGRYFTKNISPKGVVSIEENICSLYKTVSSSNVADGCIAMSYVGNTIYVRDNRYDTVSDFITGVNGQSFVYRLAQPVTVQLTAQQLTTILGTNDVWSDGGNVSVEYVADTKAYIAKVIAAALA